MVRLGIIGVGTMGTDHARRLLRGDVARCELTTVCDIVPARMESFPELKRFEDSAELIRSGEVDAALIATPHYFHTTVGIDALEQGLHVLTEKPISVHKADCERLIAAHKNPKQVFAAMFNQRTDPRFQAIKSLMASGELGELQRVNWIITDWFRSEAYYASGGWRATWRGEGGGVLLNQCPHNLDLLQWMCGMPTQVHGHCEFGKYHHIEVEDEVTAFFTYPNGATGVFVTSTGEAPGANRLEIAGDLGKVVCEGGRVTVFKNGISASEFCRTTETRFNRPEVMVTELPAEGQGGQHNAIIQNFVDAILDGAPLIAPAEEGINSVELANAMLYSTLTGKAAELPLDGAAFEEKLLELIERSTCEKAEAKEELPDDLQASF